MMDSKKEPRTRNPGFRRLEGLYTDLVSKLESLSREERLFRRRPAARAKEAAAADCFAEEADLEQVRLWAVILQETEKLRRSLYALPTWEAKEKIAVEKGKLELTARKLESIAPSAAGVVELPPVMPEEDGRAVEV